MPTTAFFSVRAARGPRLLGMLGHVLLVMVASTGAVAAGEDFTVIALPDTQFYSQDYPETFHAQTQWCIDNRGTWSIRFVTHLGDICNEAGTYYQWENAKAAMSRLELADLPFGTCCGNHDIRYPGTYYDPDGTNYLSKFAAQFYQGRTWYKGASPSGLSNYQIIRADGRDWLFLHLLVETPAAELAWAQGVLNAHREKPTMVSTHRYLYDWRVLGKGRYNDFNYSIEPLYRHDGVKAEEFWQGFLARNRQIYMIICGHCDGEYRQISTNNYGLPVHEVMVDYQDTYGNGGNGLLRVMTFRPQQNLIEVRTYSPTLNEWRTGADSQFTLAVIFADYAAARPTQRFQEGQEGYTGAVDTWINEDAKDRSYGNDDIFVVDDDTTNGWFGKDYQGQGLLRFDEMFQSAVKEGDPEPTRIPRGAVVHSATLSIKLASDTNLCDPEFYVYRMLRGWDEGSTWNSLSDGVVPGVDCDANWIAKFNGDNNPNNEYYRYLNVKPAVQAWSDGQTNHGLAILPERVDFCDDGIDVWSSEVAGLVLDSNGEWIDAISIRPALDVEFTYTVLNAPPIVTDPLKGTPAVIDEGREVKFTMSAVDPNPMDPLIFKLNDKNIGYGTGSGSVEHFELMEDEGELVFDGRVFDDETSVPAGQVTITVHNVAPTITELTGDLRVEPNQPFTFRCLATDPGRRDVLTYRWDLDDDGQHDDFAGPTGQWSFGTLGRHAVGVEVSDGDGGLAYGAFDVFVVQWRRGDLNCDGAVNFADINPFVLALGGEPGYYAKYPDCYWRNADCNADGQVNFADINPFVGLLGQ